jgi:Sodium:solute symporter family
MPNVNRLVSLKAPDVAIIIVYFAMVLGVGVYLKRYAKSGNEFFLAGREMTVWVAGLSFLSANLGAIELLGWAASAYEYGIQAAHFLLGCRFSGHGHPGPGDDAVLLHFEDALGPWLPPVTLWRWGAHVKRRIICSDDQIDVRYQYVCYGPGDEGGCRVEHSLQHLGLFPHRSDLRRDGRAIFCDLQ